MGLIPIEDLDLTFAMFVTCWILIFIFHKTNGAGITAAAYREKHQGLVVQKPVNACLGLKFNQGSCFSFSKEFSQQITSDCLKATKVNMWGKKDLQEYVPLGYKREF